MPNTQKVNYVHFVKNSLEQRLNASTLMKQVWPSECHRKFDRFHGKFCLIITFTKCVSRGASEIKVDRIQVNSKKMLLVKED